MGGPYLYGEQGRFSKREGISHQCWRKHVEQEETNSCSQRHGVSWSRRIGFPVGQQCPSGSSQASRGGVVELVLSSPDSFIGNFSLLEQPPRHHLSAFLRCLTVLRALLSSGLASPPGTWYVSLAEELGRVKFFLTLNPEVNGNAYLYHWSIKGKSVLWEGRERNW